MNQFIKLFKLGVASLALTLSLSAATVTFDGTTTGITPTSLIRQQGAYTRLTFVNSSTNTVVFGFFDTPTNVLTYVVGAYTNSIITVGTTVQTVTNILGNITSQTNNTATTSLTSVSASTNNYPKLLTFSVAPSVTTTLSLNPYQNFLNGLSLTNNFTNCVVTVQYVPAI